MNSATAAEQSLLRALHTPIVESYRCAREGPVAPARAATGLWAVEPHIGKGEIGTKWEELLVVTEDTAYWLDDDLPHVRYWQEHGAQVG